jgi:hypothetical protein
VPNSPVKAETKQKRADREVRDRLEHPDMNLFDRFMKKLIKMPKSFSSDVGKDDSSGTEKNSR